MDKAYTFSEIARAFNFDGTSLRKLFDAKEVKPARQVKVGKRSFELYGDHAYGVARAERERRDAVRAERNLPNPSVRLKEAKAAKAAAAALPGQLDALKALINKRFDELVTLQHALHADMQQRMIPVAPMPPIAVRTDGTAADQNVAQFKAMAMLAEMADTDD
jgi:hypothetical protein